MARSPSARKPLGPGTRLLYDAALKRAFGGVKVTPKVSERVLDWTPSATLILRAAVARYGVDHGQDVSKVLERIPVKWAPKRVAKAPSDAEGDRFREHVQKLPKGRRALVMLPLALGLRADEVLSLQRKHVERAVESGELVTFRKGGEEQVLPCKNAKALLKELLATPRALGGGRLSYREARKERPWRHAYEVLSATSKRSAYVQFYNLVRVVGKRARIEKMHPHALRHLFATRMMRDGAPIELIRWMLNHKDITTTMRYLHASGVDAAKYMRDY